MRVFRFSSTAGRVNSVKDLTFGGSQTKIGAALDGVREELAGLPVAGIVLVTDGADTSEGSLTNTLLNLKAEKLPVFTVGVGSAKLPRDIQIDRVSTPRTVLKGASLLVDAVITQSGYAGQTVTLDVEDDGRIVGSQKVQLPVDGSPAAVRVRATASEPGPRVFSFHVAPQQGEVVTQNNVRESLVDVRDTREKILYFEGEPRSEMKFIRRAVADDKNLQIVTLQRTADNKFLRLDVDTPDELLGGFPKTRDELFAFRGLILGSIEAAAFSADQLQMIADFVDRRGGGLLMLGGARSFGEGGYGGTPVADALPLVIDPRTRASEPTTFARLKVLPTRAGQAHAVTQIAGSEEASAARWPELPQVTTINAPLAIKPAATVLLNGTDERLRAMPALVWQPYGPRQGDRVPPAGLVGVADARQHPARGSDARELLAPDAALARGRRAVAGRGEHHDHRSRRAGRSGHDRSGRRRSDVGRAERRARRRARDAPGRIDARRAAAVDRRARRPVPRHVRQHGARRV